MYSLAIVPWLLQAWLAAGSPADFATESLLKYSTAEDTMWHSDAWGDEAVGMSHKHEQYLPPPPRFDSKEDFSFGLKESSLHSRERESRQQFEVS